MENREGKREKEGRIGIKKARGKRERKRQRETKKEKDKDKLSIKVIKREKARKRAN